MKKGKHAERSVFSFTPCRGEAQQNGDVFHAGLLHHLSSHFLVYPRIMQIFPGETITMRFSFFQRP